MIKRKLDEIDRIEPYSQLVIPSKSEINILEGFGSKKIPKAILDEKVLGKRLILENPKRLKRKKSWKHQTEENVKLTEKKKIANQTSFNQANGQERGKEKKSAKEKGKKSISKGEIKKWVVALELHSIWQEYMQKLMAKSTEKLVSWLRADWQGAKIKIIKSISQPTLVLLDSLIITRETKNLFHVIDKNDKMTQVFKKGLVFQIDKTRLFGDHLLMAPATRSTKKFKSINS